MREFLSQFYQRMELVAVVESIVNRRNTSYEMESRFQPGELDNILFSVLVFIMDTTLSEDGDCTISAVEDFLREILPMYKHHLSDSELQELTRYLIKDILQNKGTRREYPVMDYESGTRLLPIRLISDRINERNEVVYALTQQGYNFLFRTKEVDEELGFQLEEMRLKMLIQKKNYKRALEQSRELLRMLSEKRSELQQFEFQLRSNLRELSGAAYEGLVLGVDRMLDDEYHTMQEINDMVERATKHLSEQALLGSDSDEGSQRAKREIDIIEENVGRALTLQRKLLTRCEGLRNLYLGLLEDAFQYQQSRTYDLEQAVLQPLEALQRLTYTQIDRLQRGLLSPLFLPKLPPTLNLELAYARQQPLTGEELPGVFFDEDTLEEDEHRQREARRNACHVMLVQRLFEYASRHRGGFRLKELIDALDEAGQLSELLFERIFFLDMLKLYELEEVDLSLWRGRRHDAPSAGGEFDLSCCLSQISQTNPALWGVSALRIWGGPDISYVWNGVWEEQATAFRAVISDLWFEVTLDETGAQAFS